MYFSFWNCTHNPFNNAPAYQHIFLSEQHQHVVEQIEYGLFQNKELALIAGECGTGKTSFINWLSQHFDNSQYKLIYIGNPLGLCDEFFPYLLMKLGDAQSPSQHSYNYSLEKKLNQFASMYNRLIIAIDDAHLLKDPTIFDSLKVLIDFQINHQFFLMVILVGNNQLLENIAAVPQLAQRLFIQSELKIFSVKDTIKYIKHQLEEAGGKLEIFDSDSLLKIYEISQGNPRLINNICEHCLLQAYNEQKKTVDLLLLDRAIGPQKIHIDESSITDYQAKQQPQLIPAIEKETPDDTKASIATPSYNMDSETFYKTVSQTMREIYSALQADKKISLRTIEIIAERLMQFTTKEHDLLKIALKDHSPFRLESHVVNVAILAYHTASKFLTDVSQLKMLTIATLLHDIGMLKISDDILYKKGNLSSGELAQVEQHPVWGNKMVTDLFAPSEQNGVNLIAEIILQEHEREGGIGYPYKKTNKNINDLAKIIGLCDTFEALSHSRPWRGRDHPAIAIKKVIELDQSYFPIYLKKLLVTRLSFYPIGSIVKLNSGEIAEVCQINETQPLRPVIKVLHPATNDEEAMKNLLELPMLHVSKVIK